MTLRTSFYFAFNWMLAIVGVNKTCPTGYRFTWATPTITIYSVFMLAVLVNSCGAQQASKPDVAQNAVNPRQPTAAQSATSPSTSEESATSTVERASAILGGGCFWCVETDFEKLPGVLDVISGYSGGRSKQPTYEDYAAGGHREVVFVMYDPEVVTYAGLVEWLIKHIDPTDRSGSFKDRGSQYRPTIYYENETEKREAERVIDVIDKAKIYRGRINIAVEPRKPFWPAEDYHQDYHAKNGIKYQFFRSQSGRDEFVMSHWGNRANVLEVAGSIPDREPAKNNASKSDKQIVNTKPWESYQKPKNLELRKQLNPVQFNVTQQEGTEPAFRNAYWDKKDAGIYVDVLSGAPLFSSDDKYDSGTGWPSFVKPLVDEYVEYHEDRGLFTTRVEVRSRTSNSHLGHVFTDGPVARGGKRFCMNSAALRFIPKSKMEEEGYADFLPFVKFVPAKGQKK